MVSKITSKLQGNSKITNKENLHTVVRNIVSRFEPHKSKMMFAISRVVKESKIKLKPKRTISSNGGKQEISNFNFPNKVRIDSIKSIDENNIEKKNIKDMFKIYSDNILEQIQDVEKTPRDDSNSVSIDRNKAGYYNQFFPEEEPEISENNFPMKKTKNIQPVIHLGKSTL